MIEDQDYRFLAEAADQAGFLGYVPAELKNSPVDAKELAKSILENEKRKNRVDEVYLPILRGFLGLQFNDDEVTSAAETKYHNSRD